MLAVAPGTYAAPLARRGHTGELPGFNTSVYYDTTSDTSVVVLVNSDIASGNCPESPTLTDNPSELPCSAPATRIFVGLSKTLGHEFNPPQRHRKFCRPRQRSRNTSGSAARGLALARLGISISLDELAIGSASGRCSCR
jgi:hypothetical protein